MTEHEIVVTRDDLNDFVSNHTWKRVRQLIEERIRTAAFNLADPKKDDSRHAYRAEISSLSYVLSITEVIEQELQEESNG